MRPSPPAVLALVACLAHAHSARAQSESATPPADDTPAGTDPAAPEPEDALPTVDEKAADLRAVAGFLDLRIDDESATVWLVVPPPGDDRVCASMLYVESIATGIGSNDLGLDRGQLGASRVVHVRRIGRRVLFEQENLGFRATTDDRDERRAVRDSFARSVLWGAEIAALDDDGRALVDLTPFVVRDAHRVARSLEQSDQGSWSLDTSRCTLLPDAALAFPDNVELEALLTFTGSKPGGLVASVTPDATAVTLMQHHSMVRLPDDAYRRRAYDPRCGAGAVAYLDYSADLDEPIERRWIARHRLEKTDPGAAVSDVVEPITYYVDRGAPEPIRSALVEGASWWADAFEAAGFRDAFRVEVMPEGAHPLDVRYNVIQWVHRSTRGWSYGGSVEDPRTGEIIKGHVTLGSLRVRQDILLFEGLVGADGSGSGAPNDPVQIALARIRQLSAHEVGHTLGFQHNFAASTWGGRASVMDYPAPLVTLAADESVDLSNAYAVGIGDWDRLAVRYAYSQFAPGADEAAALRAILDAADADGMLFLTDQDARPAGAAHPLANLWDNGDDPVAALATAMNVRRRALDTFGLDRIADGRSVGRLHDVFVPVYLHHRYQLVAAVKVVGGREYRYGVRGGAPIRMTVVDDAWQRRALDGVLDCLRDNELIVRESTLALLAPPGPGDTMTGEHMDGRSDPAFDVVAAAVTAAAPAIDGLLQRERAARLVEQHARDARMPGLEYVIDELVARTVLGRATSDRHAAVHEGVAFAVVDGLARLAMDTRANAGVRARADRALARLRRELTLRPDEPAAEGLLRAVERALDRKTAGEWTPSAPAPMPPGDPIGCGEGG